MESHKLRIEKTARYCTQGNADASEVWILLHGYGMLASQMINSFPDMETPEIYLVAPEGLSRFYWKGFDGPVVASWMTREDRQDEIYDYIGYLNKLVVDLKLDTKTIHVLGFSQGVATMSRWLAQCNFPIDKLVMWAGEPPSDVDYTFVNTRVQQAYYVYGTQDQFVGAEQVQKVKSFFESIPCAIQFKTFEGKHELDEQVINELLF